MRTVYLAAIMSTALLLGGCGDGGSGSTAPTPAPTPTPSPSPTPTPAATRFQAEGAGPLIAELRFQRNEVPETSPVAAYAATTNRAGLFFNGIPDAVARSGATAPFIDDGQNSITAVGVDKLTGQRVILYAPRGATVVSPVTSLIAFTRDEARVKQALGLQDGPFRLLDPTRELTRFSATANGTMLGETILAESRRVRAANIRTVAYLHALNQLHLGPGLEATVSPNLDLTPDYLVAVIRANAATRLDGRDGLATVIRTLPRWSANTGVYRDDVIAAAAGLIAAYAEVVGVEVGSDDDARRLMLGIQGYLKPTLAELARQNSAAAAAKVAALTSVDVRRAIASFAEPLVANDGLLFPAPDFLPVTPGGELTLPLYNANWPASLAMNDTVGFATYPAAPIAKEGLTLAAVAVPAQFADLLNVSIQANSVAAIRPARTASGIVWFDYTFRAPGGAEAIGRAYVLLPS